MPPRTVATTSSTSRWRSSKPSSTRGAFCGVHRATIVNVAFVQELDAGVDGGVIVRLKDDKKTELAVARDRVRELKERLGI